MLETLKGAWWLVVLRGVCAVLFGILAFVWPATTGEVLVLLFGAYAFVNGSFTLGLAFRVPRGAPGKGSLMVLGLLAVVAGVVTFFYPGITALSLLSLIAVWAVFTGIFEISTAIKLRKELSNEWMLILGGALSVVFGVLVFTMPRAGAISIVWLIGTYAVIYGAMLLTVAFRLRGLVSEARRAARLA